MRIIEKFSKSQGPLFSFEFYPPKTEEGEQKLWGVLQELKELDPAYVSVTHGAGGSSHNKTVDLTIRIQKELELETMAHFTCAGYAQDEICGVVDSLIAGGVNNIMALRGDPPKGQEKFVQKEGGFQYGNELISFLRQSYADKISVGAACYPEGHIEAVSLDVDIDNLKRKVDAGTDFLITQLFFDNRIYFDFMDKIIAKGINIPVVPGVMPIQSFEQVKRFTKMCGATIAQDLLKSLEANADQPERIQELGIVHATIQSLGLIQSGAPGIHFYTLNKSTATRAILRMMRMQARLPQS